MKTFWYATLVTLTSLVLGALVSQSFGADRGGRSFSGRSFSGGISNSARSVGQVRSGGLNSSVARKVGGSLNSQNLGGLRPPVKVSPIVNRPAPIKPISGPIKPFPVNPIKNPISGPIKPFPVNPIKNPIVNPVKPPIVGPIKPIGPIKPPIVGPIKPPIGPIGPIKPPIVGPVGPIGPLPPICPPHCPPKHPPHCPPNHGHGGPWYPFPGWVDCYRPCATPICVTLPTYVTETVVVETPVAVPPPVEEAAADAEEAAAKEAAADAAKAGEASDETLMQVPVGATLQLADKTLGEQQGQVILQMDAISVPAQVNDWKAEQVNVTLPMFGLAAPTKAHIWLMRADGQVANKLPVELVPAKLPGEDPSTVAAASSTDAVSQN